MAGRLCWQNGGVTTGGLYCQNPVAGNTTCGRCRGRLVASGGVSANALASQAAASDEPERLRADLEMGLDELSRRSGGASVAMMTLAGSRAYGFGTPTSDTDWRGVYVTPTIDLTLPVKTPDTVNFTAPTDVAAYEIGRFCELAAGGNPNVVELLFADDYAATSSEWERLVACRKAFLSRNVFRRYAGYADGQIKKLESGVADTGDATSEDGRRRRAKFCRHTARLVLQGEQLSRTGSMTIRLSEADLAEVHAAAQLGVESIDAFIAKWKPRIKSLGDGSDTSLPDQPDWDTIVGALRVIRRQHSF